MKINNIVKKLISISLILTIGFCSSFTNSEIVLAGKNPPSTSSYVNLANGSYTTDNTTMKYKVYTNVCFKGVTKMKVCVSAVSVNNPNGMRNETDFYCYLYNTSTKKATKYTLSKYGGDVFYCTNMSASTKYYIYFVKTDDTKEYTFTATMSDAS